MSSFLRSERSHSMTVSYGNSSILQEGSGITGAGFGASPSSLFIIRLRGRIRFLITSISRVIWCLGLLLLFILLALIRSFRRRGVILSCSLLYLHRLSSFWRRTWSRRILWFYFSAQNCNCGIGRETRLGWGLRRIRICLCFLSYLRCFNLFFLIGLIYYPPLPTLQQELAAEEWVRP